MSSRTVARDITERWPESASYRCSSEDRTKASREVTSSVTSASAWAGTVPLLREMHCCCRCWKRCHRTVRGASTLMRTKKGRLLKISRTSWSGMSVVTHRSSQCLVTKSRRASAVGKLSVFLDGRRGRCLPPGRETSVVPLRDDVSSGLDGADCPLDSSPDLTQSCLKAWCSTRYWATVLLPAHLPWGYVSHGTSDKIGG